jgi:hypothetical protein
MTGLQTLYQCIVIFDFALMYQAQLALCNMCCSFLPSLLQGDFVVPSSRQDLDLDSPWNRLLHSKVPALFAAAFHKFRALRAPPEQQQLFWLDWWLRCVPLPEHVHVSRAWGWGPMQGKD